MQVNLYVARNRNFQQVYVSIGIVNTFLVWSLNDYFKYYIMFACQELAAPLSVFNYLCYANYRLNHSYIL
jgi:hypothetical protein